MRKRVIRIETAEKSNRKYAEKAEPWEHNLRKELAEYEKAGISLWLEGKQSDPGSIVSACVMREDHCYMRDYYTNEKNEIYGIDFNRL